MLSGAMDSKLSPITDDEKFDALTAMFVRNNNQAKRDNDGPVNKKVVEFIVKRDPQLYDDWPPLFTTLKTSLVPKVLRGNRQYEFIPYPPTTDEDSIYTKNASFQLNQTLPLNKNLLPQEVTTTVVNDENVKKMIKIIPMVQRRKDKKRIYTVLVANTPDM